MKLTPKNRILISFPLLLLLLLATCAIYVVMSAAISYKDIVSESALNDSARISAAYIEEKIHQNDSSDSSISAGELDGCDALLITNSYEGKEYTTYIYCNDGKLYELMAENSIAVDKTMGTEVTELDSMNIEQVQKNRFNVTCQDQKKHTTNIVIGTRSE